VKRLTIAVALAAVTILPLWAQDSKREKALRLCAEGEVLILERRIDEALEKFKKALDVDIKCIEAHTRYQDILLDNGQRDKLLKDYREFVQIMPKSALFNFLYGRLYDTDLDLQQQYLKKAVELDPKFFDARFALGVSYLSGKQYKKALEQLEECRKLKPGDPFTELRTADVHLKLGKYEKARECYKKLEKNFPKLVPYALGRSYAYEGKHDEAVKHFEKAWEKGLLDVDFLVEWAQSCFGIGRKSEAVKVLEKFFLTNAGPQDFAHLEKVILSWCDPRSDLNELQKGRLDKAVALLEGEPSKPGEAHTALTELAKEAGNSEEIHQMLGRTLLALGKKEEAVAQFKKAIELNPDYPAPVMYLALLDLRANKMDDARKKMLKVLTLDPFSADANTFMTVISYNEKKYKQALAYAKRTYQVTGSTRAVGDVLCFAELYLEDESLFLDKFKVGKWEVIVYKGMPKIDPRRCYAYRFLTKKDGKTDRIIVVNSRWVRDVDGPDPDAYAMYHFLEETLRDGRMARDRCYQVYGSKLPKLDDIVKQVKKILSEGASGTDRQKDK
jgi:tetratricopeptide (TPR) repeat protein